MYEERISTCGKRIAEALSIRGLKPIDLCKLTNVPKSSMSLYINGSHEPKQNRIYSFAKALNVSEAWLMGYDVPMERVAPPPKADALTEEEAALVVAFRKLSDDKRKLVGDMAKMLSEEKN